MKSTMTLICALALLAALLTGCAARLPEEDAAQPPQNAERAAAEEVVQPTVEEVDEPAEETRSAQELLDVYLGRDNAPAQYAMALRLLHFSPEPRVIAPLIDSARLLGLDAQAAFHEERFRQADPDDYARWARRRGIKPD